MTERAFLLNRAISVGTGLVGYNLQAPAKRLAPLLSPFRNASRPHVRKGTRLLRRWAAESDLKYQGGLKPPERVKWKTLAEAA